MAATEKTHLACLRKTNGWTQQQLAEASGVSLTQIKKIETRDINFNNVSVKNAVKLADALGVDVKDLIQEEL